MRRFLPSVVALVIVATFSVLQRDVLGDIVNRLTHIHPAGLPILLGAAVVMVVARAAFLASTSPGLSIKNAVTADQTALAAGYGIALGGGLVGTGMRIHMFTRWGLPNHVTASSIVATAVFPSFTTWGLPIFVLAPLLFAGTADAVQTTVFIAGVALVLISVVFWWIALQSEWMFRHLGQIAHWTKRLALRRLPRRLSRVRKFVERSDPLEFSYQLRTNLRILLRHRWHLMLLSSLGTLCAAFLCLLSSAWLFGAKGLTIHEALVAFSLVRVLIALSPIPGAAGIAELGLIALLERSGVSVVDATGTTLLYRSVTWFFPIVAGTVLWWRYSRSLKGAENGSIRNNDSQFQDPRGSIPLHG